MNGNPNRLTLLIRPDHPVPLMRHYLQPIPLPHAHHLAILKLQPCGALEQQHKLVFVLVVPAFFGGGVAFGDNAFNVDVVCFDQGFEEFGGEVFGDVLVEVFHGVFSRAWPAPTNHASDYMAGRGKGADVFLLFAL